LGIFGIRATHGTHFGRRCHGDGAELYARGWLAAKRHNARRCGEVFFGPIPDRGDDRLLIAADAFEIPIPAMRKRCCRSSP